MADEELEIEEGGKKKGKMMLIIIIVAVLLLGGGGAYFFLFMGDDPEAEEGVEGEVAEQVEQDLPAEGEAMYVAMPRAFTFNAPGVARERIVQIEVQLMVRGSVNE